MYNPGKIVQMIVTPHKFVWLLNEHGNVYQIDPEDSELFGFEAPGAEPTPRIVSSLNYPELQPGAWVMYNGEAAIVANATINTVWIEQGNDRKPVHYYDLQPHQLWLAGKQAIL